MQSKAEHTFILYVTQLHVSAINSYHQAEHKTVNKKTTLNTVHCIAL